MNNDLCRMVGCDFPLFAFSHCRDVVVAVSKAGGFGERRSTAKVYDREGRVAERTLQDQSRVKWGFAPHTDGEAIAKLSLCAGTQEWLLLEQTFDGLDRALTRRSADQQEVLTYQPGQLPPQALTRSNGMLTHYHYEPDLNYLLTRIERPNEGEASTFSFAAPHGRLTAASGGLGGTHGQALGQGGGRQAQQRGGGGQARHLGQRPQRRVKTFAVHRRRVARQHGARRGRHGQVQVFGAAQARGIARGQHLRLQRRQRQTRRKQHIGVVIDPDDDRSGCGGLSFHGVHYRTLDRPPLAGSGQQELRHSKQTPLTI